MPPEVNTPPASPGGATLPSDTISESATPSDVGSGDEFSGLDPSYDEDSIQLVDMPEPTPQAEEPSEQVDVPVAPPVPPKVPKPAEPVQAPQQTQPPPAASEQPQRTLSEELVTHRDALIDTLATTRFALSPQEVEALEADAVAEMPRLLSKVYYETMTSVVNHIQNNVPALIQHVMKVSNAATSAESRFFQKFSSIDPQKHGADVVNFAHAFRAANPRVGEEELFNLVGTAVMTKHGLTNAPRPNGASAQPQPFVPARAGASVKVTPEQNPWAGLGQDFDD